MRSTCISRLLLFAVLLAGINELQAQSPYQRLVWAEEFNTPGMPDGTKWNYDTGRGCPNNCGWGNNELQNYTSRKKNIHIANGSLHIKAYRESLGGASFTSAKIHTKNKFQVQYGRIEIRAQLPEGIGTWPAAWMLGANIDTVGWPACGEIDIVEHRDYERNKIFGTLHYPGHFGDNADGNTRISNDVTTAYHTYSAEWDAQAIRIYTDGKLVHEVVNHPGIPFQHPFYLILNLAMGGSFAGPVDPGFQEGTFSIDYIRVYQ